MQGITSFPTDSCLRTGQSDALSEGGGCDRESGRLQGCAPPSGGDRRRQGSASRGFLPANRSERCVVGRRGLRPRKRAPSGVCPAVRRGSERQGLLPADSCLRTVRAMRCRKEGVATAKAVAIEGCAPPSAGVGAAGILLPRIPACEHAQRTPAAPRSPRARSGGRVAMWARIAVRAHRDPPPRTASTIASCSVAR